MYSYTNMSINPKKNEIFFTKFDTHMYGHTLRTHNTFGGIVLLGGAIIEQNMTLPLTIIEYYYIKCYILRMHWCTITKLCMYTKIIWLQHHLLVKTDQPFNRITRGCIYDFSAISVDIIFKLPLALVVAFGLMLHAMLSSSFCRWVLGPVIAAWNYIFVWFS